MSIVMTFAADRLTILADLRLEKYVFNVFVSCVSKRVV